MCELPLEVEVSKMLINSENHFVTQHALTLSAMLSVPNIFLRPPDYQK